MSVGKTISEYLTFVKNGIKNGDKIIEAIRVSAQMKDGNPIITEEAIAEIMKRKAICASCPFNSLNAKKERNYEDPAPLKDVTHCTLCQCRIGTDNGKEYCLSCQCGMSEWNRRNPELQPMELKWTAFEQPVEKNKTELKTKKDE
jgi:hypothetical protein